MNFAETLRPTSENLWSAAIETLPENLKSNINFAQSSKHKSLDELLEATNEARKRFIDKSWSFKRKSGEVVIFRDVLAKAARWLDNFKQVGDILASIDPLHAAPPWAGVRFLLIVATGDLKAYSSLLEATIHIAEMIYRGALVEKLLSNSRSETAAELRRVLIKLYAAILAYLSEECAYYDENGFKRVSKHGISSPTKFEEAMTTINEGQTDVDRCINFFGIQSQLNCAAEIERRLKDSYDLIRDSDDRAIEYLEQHDKARRIKILRWISEQPYEKHHIEANKEVLEGTGTWLLDEVIFIRWMNESASSILWLYGIPGSGKSKLTSVVIKNALQKFKRSQTSALGYFYCSRNPAEPGRSDAASIVASIARQLSTAEYEGPLLDATIKMYEEKENQGFASGSLSLQESIGLILKLLEKYQDAIIVIDALDECNEETRGDLLDALEELLKESPCLLKVFVSSRTDQNIVYRLETYPNLELSSGRNAKDIDLYARYETKRLIKRGDLMRRSQRKEELCDKIIAELICKADGMFRWVSLQLQTLCKLATDVAIEERLGRLPKTLAELYKDILNTINDQESEADRQFAQNAFSWLLCGREQLTTEDFLAAVSVTKHRSGCPIEKDQLLQICSNLIVFDSTAKTFRFAHLTVREFLEDQETYNLASAGALVAEACLLNLINMSPEISSRAPFVRYSCLFWAEHVKKVACQPQSHLHDSLCKFLADEHAQSCFYFWHRRVENFIIEAEFPLAIPHRIKASISYVPRILLVVCAYDLCGVLSLKRWEQLSQKRPRNMIAETHHTIAFRYGNGEILKWQLNSQILPRLTEKALVDAAGNGANGEKVMALLLDSGGTDIAITKEVVMAASGNYSSGEGVMALLLSRAPVKAHHITDGAVVLIINRFGPVILEQLLGKSMPKLQITEDMMVAAVQNDRHDEQVLSLLLNEEGGSIPVTERIVISAAEKNQRSDVMLRLLSNEGARKIAITEKVITAAARNRGSGLEILDLLVKMMPGGKIPVTEDAIHAVIVENIFIRKIDWGLLSLLLSHLDADVVFSEETFVDIMSAIPLETDPDLIDLFLSKAGSKILTTPTVVEECVRVCTLNVLESLFKTSLLTIQITKNMVQTAATRHFFVEILELFLGKGKVEPPVMQNIITVLLQFCSPGDFQLLLTRVELHITEENIEAVAANDFRWELTEILLGKWGGDFPITQKAAELFLPTTHCISLREILPKDNRYPSGQESCDTNTRRQGLGLLIERNKARTSMKEGVTEYIIAWGDGEIIQQLLEKWGDEIMLSRELMDAADRSGPSPSIKALLLQHCAAPIIDIEDVLCKVLEYCDAHALRKFLRRTGLTIQTNEKVANAVSENSDAEEVLKLLLIDHEIESPVTEGLVTSVCRNFSTEIFRLFLSSVGKDIQVTEDVILAIVENSEYGEGILAIVQSCGKTTIPITDKVIEAAARWNTAVLMKRLLDMWHEGVMATEGMIWAAPDGDDNGNAITTMLPNGQSAGDLITDAIVHAAMVNVYHKFDILILLLEIDDATFSITKRATKTAAQVFYLEEFRQLLIDSDSRALITEELIEGVVNGYTSTYEKLSLLSYESGGQIPITEGIIKKAIGDNRISVKSLELLLDKGSPQIPITGSLVEEALKSRSLYPEKLELLLDKCGPKISVTEDMIEEAVMNRGITIESLQVLLDKSEPQIQITERLVEGALKNTDNSKERGWMHSVREAIILGTANQGVADQDVNIRKLRLLLDKGGPQVPITEKVVRTAIRSRFYGDEFLEIILRQGREDVTITQATLKYAAKYAPGDNLLTDLLLHFPCVPQEEFPWPINCRKRFSSPQRNVRNKRQRAAKYRKGTRSRHRKMLRTKERGSEAQARSMPVWGSSWTNWLLSCIIFVVLCLVLGYLPWSSF